MGSVGGSPGTIASGTLFPVLCPPYYSKGGRDVQGGVLSVIGGVGLTRRERFIGRFSLFFYTGVLGWAWLSLLLFANSIWYAVGALPMEMASRHVSSGQKNGATVSRGMCNCVS